jgi:hypothetical protein
LILDVSTTFSATKIQLHETYEGRFSLVTTWNKPQVVVDSAVDDPKSEGRRRTVNVDRDMVKVTGAVWWGDGGGTERGNVKVGTTWAPVILKL